MFPTFGISERAGSKPPRIRQEQAEGVDGMCMWAGRNGPLLAHGAIEQFCTTIKNADSLLFRMVLSKSSEQERVMALRFMEHAKGRLVEQLSMKFSFWQQMPHMLVGLFGMYMGVSISKCCALARTILRHLTEAKDRSKLHRVSAMLLANEQMMAPVGACAIVSGVVVLGHLVSGVWLVLLSSVCLPLSLFHPLLRSHGKLGRPRVVFYRMGSLRHNVGHSVFSCALSGASGTQARATMWNTLDLDERHAGVAS